MNPMWRKALRLLLAVFLMTALLPLPAMHAYADADAAIITDAVQHPGTRINLFDYWVTPNQNDSDYLPVATHSDTLTSGINAPWGEDKPAAQLKFSKNMNGGTIGEAQGKIPANIWTGVDANKLQPRTGIVKNVLEGGYPVTRVDNNDTGTKITAEQSLAYLFDPWSDAAGKASYYNVSGLLRQDELGYYYYDCTQNFAEYYKDEYGKNAFKLYKEPGVKKGKGDKGQFFPFNNFKQVKDLDREDPKILHYFGLSMITRFVQLRDGLAYNRKDHVVYEFSGDDDVWIFIDDVLVADLGGIHDAASLKIDFATGDISINGGTNVEYTSTLLKQFEAAYGADNIDKTAFKGNTFADDTYHTMKFFYLERGNSESNLSLKFNLAEIPETYVYKVDQQGNPVQGAEFALYAADEHYTIREKAPICQNTTDEKGKLVFLTEDDMPLAIKELAKISKYFVLQEVTVPDGYRAETPNINLYIHEGNNGANLLLVDDMWGSGAYAVPSVTIRATADVYEFDRDNPTRLRLHEASDIMTPSQRRGCHHGEITASA